MRDYEQRQIKQGRAADAEGDVEGSSSPRAEKLNALWKKIRDFLTDVDAAGNKVELKRGQDPARIRFQNACRQRVDPQANIEYTLPFEKVRQAFLSSYLPDPPTDAEFKQLFSALECWYNEDNRIVNYSKILEAITGRQKSCMYGIFPRIMLKQSAASERQAELDKRAEAAQKEADRLKEEERRRLEEKNKTLDRLKRESLNKAGGQRGASPTKEDLRRMKREEDLLREEEKLAKEAA